jgi:hypothetical protein
MKIEVTCECLKSSNITSMTEAFFGFKPGTLSQAPQKNTPLFDAVQSGEIKRGKFS